MTPTRWLARAFAAALIVGSLLLSFGLSNGPSSADPAPSVSSSTASGQAAVNAAAAAQTYQYPNDVDGVDPDGTNETIAQLQAAAPNTTIQAHRLIIDGLVRSYLVIEPVHVTAALAVIVFLSGAGVKPAVEASRDDLLTLANAGKAILVYPTAFNQTWNVQADGCCGDAASQNIDDVQFLTSLFVVVDATLPVAANSNFLVGYSNGGKMAYDFMCGSGNMVDAIAINAASPLQACTDTSQPPKSILVMIGSDDQELPVTGLTEPATQALTDAGTAWRTRDGCATASTTTTMGWAELTTTANCQDSTKVTTVLYANEGHNLVTSSLLATQGGTGTPGFDQLIWQFFNSVPFSA